jgi:anti-sigma28 factor (negative regulator of flagellin synthesis)
MNVKETKGLERVERVAAAVAAAPVVKRDRVTVDEPARSERVTVASQKAGGARAARFAQLATAIKSGQYRPDAGRLADQLLDAAELDARLRAMLKG